MPAAALTLHLLRLQVAICQHSVSSMPALSYDNRMGHKTMTEIAPIQTGTSHKHDMSVVLAVIMPCLLS